MLVPLLLGFAALLLQGYACLHDVVGGASAKMGIHASPKGYVGGANALYRDAVPLTLGL